MSSSNGNLRVKAFHRLSWFTKLDVFSWRPIVEDGVIAKIWVCRSCVQARGQRNNGWHRHYQTTEGHQLTRWYHAQSERNILFRENERCEERGKIFLNKKTNQKLPFESSSVFKKGRDMFNRCGITRETGRKGFSFYQSYTPSLSLIIIIETTLPVLVISRQTSQPTTSSNSRNSTTLLKSVFFFTRNSLAFEQID